MAPAYQRVSVSVEKAAQVEEQLNGMGSQQIINYAEYHYNGKHTNLKLELSSNGLPRLTRYGGSPYSALAVLLDDNTEANALNNILEPCLGTWAKVFRKCKHYSVGNGDFIQIDEVEGLPDRYIFVYVDGNTGHALNELDYYMQMLGIINNPNISKPYAYLVAGL